MSAAPCAHLADVRDRARPAYACPHCSAAGDSWKTLRQCMTCGEVGCCDSSKNKHATAHFKATGHPVMRSIEAGESWMWCFEDEATYEPPAAPSGR